MSAPPKRADTADGPPSVGRISGQQRRPRSIWRWRAGRRSRFALDANHNPTARVVIDMQNDFCSEGGCGVDHLGADYTPDCAPMTARFLRNLGIRSIPFTGINTDQCVMHSLTDANFLGNEGF
jgi:hypothetical protein